MTKTFYKSEVDLVIVYNKYIDKFNLCSIVLDENEMAMIIEIVFIAQSHSDAELFFLYVSNEIL